MRRITLGLPSSSLGALLLVLSTNAFAQEADFSGLHHASHAHAGDALALSVDPILGHDQTRHITQAADDAFAYFETIIEERRRQPREDLVSALLAAEEGGDRLTHEELLSVMLLILVAGNETTRNLIGNGMLALLRNPDQLQRLRQDRHLLDSAVDELLRFDSPERRGRC